MDTPRARLYWTCQLVGWLTYLGFWLTLSVVLGGTPVPLASQLAVMLGNVVLSIAWTHGYRAVIRRAGWLALSPIRLLPRVVAGSVLVGPAIAVSCIPLAPLYGDAGRPLRIWLPWAIGTAAFSVLTWSVVYFGVHYFERWRQAERDKLELAVHAAESKLDALRSQLNPHFLFNCLNSVRALIAEDPAKAHAAVTSLSQLIRYSLQATHLPMVALGAELEMIATYLALETIRFEERLASELDATPDARGVPIPPMLVQGLVENAVKHGIERHPAGGVIRLAAWCDDGTLRVRVTNPGTIAAPTGSTGVGLRNARERLRLLYGARASLSIGEADGRVIVELAVPAEAGAA